MKGTDRHTSTPNTAEVYEAAINRVDRCVPWPLHAAVETRISKACVARGRTIYIEMVA